MNPLSKSAILDSADRPLESVDVPEWGGAVFVRVMSGKERNAFEATITGTDGQVNVDGMREKLLVRCLADEKGDRLFADEDTDALGNKSSAVLQRLFEVANRINAMTKKEVDALQKN